MIKPNPIVHRLFIVAAVIIGFGAAMPAHAQDGDAAAKAEEFESLLKRVRSATGDASEDKALRLIEVSRELGRDYAATLAIKSYLSRHYDASDRLILAAADTARRGGDLSAAISRYKSYLRETKPDQTAGEVAAKLYRTQLQLQKQDDAYVSMREFGDRFRKSAAARKYDRWFLQRASRRNDYPALAQRLATILKDGMPLEAERVAVWDDIDRLMQELTRADEPMYEAVQPARQIASMLRNDKRRALRAAFIAENLNYAATYAAKDEQARKNDFRRVASAAMAYIKFDPTARTLKDVVVVLGGGYRHSNQFAHAFKSRWGKEKALRQSLFVDGFNALKDDKQRAELIGWRMHDLELTPHLASAEQWIQLCDRNRGAVAAADRVDSLPIVFEADSVDIWKTQAGYLRKATGEQPAAVRALAASNGDLEAALRHLLAKETWHLHGSEFRDAIMNHIWPAISSFSKRGDDSGLSDLALDQALADAGRKHIASTPLAVLDRELAQRYLMAAWRTAGSEYKRKPVIDHVQSLDWVAWDKNERESVIQPAYSAFRDWAEQVRRDADEGEKRIANWEKRVERERQQVAKLKERAAKLKDQKDKQEEFKRVRSQHAEAEKSLKEAEQELAAQREQVEAVAAAVEQISPIDEAFTRSLDPAVSKNAKAPGSLAANLSQLNAAINAGQQDAYQKAVRATYKLVRDYEAKKTPFGAAALRMALWNREGVDSLPLQLEMFADQLKRWEPGFDDQAIKLTLKTITDSHGGRVELWRTHRSHREVAVKLSNVLQEALSNQIDNGVFYDQAFSWLRSFRSGHGWNGWHGGDQNKALLKKMIESQALLKLTDYRVYGAFAAPTYQWLVVNRWDDLRNDFRADRAFDDMFIAEAEQKGWLDPAYLRYGDDRGNEIATLAAQMLSADPKLPLPYGDNNDSPWTRDALFRWYRHARRANPEDRQAFFDKIESYWGKSRYDHIAMGYGYIESVNDLPSDDDDARDRYFQRLRTYVERARQYPQIAQTPSLHVLRSIKSDSITEEELQVLRGVVDVTRPDAWQAGDGHTRLGMYLLRELSRRGRQGDLLALAPTLWRIGVADNRRDLSRRIRSWTQDQLENENYDLAVVFAGVGLDVLGSSVDSDFQSSLRNIQARANANVSGVIPVERDDRRYPLFAAQADFLAGKTEAAWKGYVRNHRLLMQHMREFDPTFLIWLVRRNTDFGRFAAAEELARAMEIWFEQRSAAVDPELQAQRGLAYANIAYARQEYPRARSLYERVAVAQAYRQTRAQKRARVMVAEVDRVTGRYDEASETLEKIARESGAPAVRADALYHMALVKFDQEEYAEASDITKQVFVNVPDHPLARILEARINLKLQKLEEPTEIYIGTVTKKRFIVPGKVLKVGMEDPNLSVVGSASMIELKAWTESGDEEWFTLTPFGDSKTRFRGEVMTELAPIQKDDGRLQVLGEDTVYYDFSKSFREVNNVRLAQPEALRVVSNAQLLASTGKILSEEEKQQLELERQIRASLEGRGSGRGNLDREREGDIVKPGNQINVRVIDADRSATADRDEIPVKITASSGDVISRLMLEESDTHSGVFEGVVQTREGSAIAYASDSADGRNPNFAISAGDYPAWVALHDAKRPKWFSVDINDRVRAGAMRIEASEPGRKLKRFVLEVSPAGKNFQIVGKYPGGFEPWDGSPRVEYVPLPDAEMATEPEELRSYVRIGHLTQAEKKTRSIKDLSINWDFNDVRRMNAGHHWNVYHFRAAFYQNERRVRRFEVNVDSDRTHVHMFLDGEQITNDDGKTDFRKSVDRGVHVIDLYVASWRDTKFQLLTDAAEPPFEKPLPAAAIDPANSPQIREQIKREPAKITANEDGTQFDVQFGKDTLARVVRMTILDYETDAPAINRIVLNDVDGKQVLPTGEDFMELRKNRTLEIVPGDEVTINYEDPLAIEANDQLHEAFLEAAYTDAEVEAAFVKMTGSGAGRKTELIELRRFEPGDAVSLMVDDPDMDVSEKQDTISFTVRTDTGHTVTLEAMETQPYSGVFVGRFFPIDGEPKRESEIPVQPAEGIQVMYLDEHNTDPGVPWERIVNLEQVTWVTPEVRIYDFESSPMPREQVEEAIAEAEESDPSLNQEFVPPRYSMLINRPLEAGNQPQSTGSLAFPLVGEILWPTVAKSPESTVTIYAQTSSGRAMAGAGGQADDVGGGEGRGRGQAGPGPGMGGPGGGAAMGPPREEGEAADGAEPGFDISVPGTIKMSMSPSEIESIGSAPGYGNVVLRGDMYATDDPVGDGRFTFRIPLELGSPEEESLAVDDEYDPRRDSDEVSLKVNGEDTIYIGFKYVGPNGEERWITREVPMTSDPMADVMERRYQELVDSIQVGQKLYFRVIDFKRDVSDEKDEFDLALRAGSGAEQSVRMSETFSHSGVFKGLIQVRHREEFGGGEETGEKAEAETSAALAMAVPVVYGDQLTAAYTPQREGYPVIERHVIVRKGDAGNVLPFTKRFADPEIAVQTQFTMAESYFELAKRHRELGNEDLARVKVLQGKKLLEEALVEFTDTAMRAQAEYLLANLAMEFGDDAKNTETKKRFYNEAVTRFSDLVSTYPDGEYAPKAQYKKALVYEKMSEFQPSLIDQASEEYVKLSYRYPEHELVADTIVRLGEYFRNKGRAMRDEAASLAERGEAVEAEKKKIQARKMFVTASQVLSRLSERFPQHNLAGKTLVVAGQAAMQGENYELAIETFEKVIEDTEMENDLRAMAMFWSGRANLELKDLEAAYVNLKKLTWDYPETDWARYARGILASNEALIRIGKDLMSQ